MKGAVMQQAIVTVKRQQESRVRDLEVPTDVEAGRLAQMIAQALHWESDAAGQPIEYEIMAEPLGRTLGPQESLADAGAWDGAWLVFQPVGGLPQPPPSPPPGPPEERPPGWDDWDLDQLPGLEQEEAPLEKTGFVWKQLD
jgi:hypothetical protein